MISVLEVAAIAATPGVARVHDQILDLVRDFRTPHPVLLARIARVVGDDGPIMMSSAGDTIRVRFKTTRLTGRARRQLGQWQVILAVDLNRKTTIGLGYSNTSSRLPEVQLASVWPVLRGVLERRASRFCAWAERTDVPHTIRVPRVCATRWARVARYVPTITT